jgi:hypothetical protein
MPRELSRPWPKFITINLTDEDTDGEFENETEALENATSDVVNEGGIVAVCKVVAIFRTGKAEKVYP